MIGCFDGIDVVVVVVGGRVVVVVLVVVGIIVVVISWLQAPSTHAFSHANVAYTSFPSMSHAYSLTHESALYKSMHVAWDSQ